MLQQRQQPRQEIAKRAAGSARHTMAAQQQHEHTDSCHCAAPAPLYQIWRAKQHLQGEAGRAIQDQGWPVCSSAELPDNRHERRPGCTRGKQNPGTRYCHAPPSCRWGENVDSCAVTAPDIMTPVALITPGRGQLQKTVVQPPDNSGPQGRLWHHAPAYVTKNTLQISAPRPEYNRRLPHTGSFSDPKEMRTFLGTLFGPKNGHDGDYWDSPCHCRCVQFWCRHMAPKVGYADSSLHGGLKTNLPGAASP